MGQVLHGSATTTEAVRRAIQDSQESLRALAARYGVNPKTILKWKKRSTVADLPTGSRQPKSSVLSMDEEAIIIAFRRHTLLPLDDCLYALQSMIPHLTGSSLHRCLQRHGVNRLPDVEGDKETKKKFKSYPIGFLHIDIAEVRTKEGKLYLFVGIDRTSKYAFVQLHEQADRPTAVIFLEALIEAVPYRRHTILTDNGIQFADLPRNRDGWTYREALKKAGAIDGLFKRFDEVLRASGFLAMSCQIVDATIVAAPKQRHTIEEKQAIREGRTPEGWVQNPARLAQKDRDARWTVKYTKAKPQEDGSLPPVDLAIPAFGYKNHIAVDRAYGLIRKWTATHAAAHDGARLEDVLDRSNTASDVWADAAYRSAKNEEMHARRGFVSRIHRKKPKGRVMPERTQIWNARKSRVRSAVEHVFAHQKGPMGLVVRTIGIARAKVKIGMANLAYNMRRLVWLSGKYAAA